MLGVVAVGLWFGGDDPLQSLAFWASRAAIQGVSAALIALFIWALLSRRRVVSYVLVLGVGTAGLFLYDAASAWQIDRERLHANVVLKHLEDGERMIESLTEEEKANPYVDAYLVMRDLYWELNALASDRMAGYRSAYESYTETGGFLDVQRLRNEFDLWYSLSQIQDLEVLLKHMESEPLDAADTRWSVRLLKVDPVTQAAYAEDLAESLKAITGAQAASITRERRSLQLMRNALEVLIESEGRYRIENDRIIFDDPGDAARFTGKGRDI